MADTTEVPLKSELTTSSSLVDDDGFREYVPLAQGPFTLCEGYSDTTSDNSIQHGHGRTERVPGMPCCY